jgi:hypothetical protein
VSSYGNEYLTLASPILPLMKSSSSAISKTLRAPLRGPAAVVELHTARVHAAPRQLACGSMVDLPTGLRQRLVSAHEPSLPRSGPHSIMYSVKPASGVPASGVAARNLSLPRSEVAAQMQTRVSWPSLRLQVISVPTIADALVRGLQSVQSVPRVQSARSSRERDWVGVLMLFT